MEVERSKEGLRESKRRMVVCCRKGKVLHEAVRPVSHNNKTITIVIVT